MVSIFIIIFTSMRRIFTVSILIIIINTFVFSQINKTGIPFITNYSPQEYSASEQNWAIVQDNRGIMYFGNNDDGVLEYDGINWRKIPIDNNSIIRSLAIDSLGKIYVGGVGEFGYLIPNKSGKMIYQSLLPKIDTSDNDFPDIWKTYATKDGVYFCSTKKIFLFNADSIKVINLSNGSFFSFYLDEMYLGHFLDGLKKFNGNSFEIVEKGGFFEKKGIFTINEYINNNLLIGCYPNGLYSYNKESGKILENFKNIEANKFLKNNQLYHSFKLNNGQFIFATIFDGIIIMDSKGNILNRYSKNEGLQNETVINLYSKSDDLQSPLWMALNSGIGKIEINSPFKKFTEKQGLLGSVNDIHRFNTKLFVATSLGVFYLDFDDSKIPEFKKVEGIDDQTWSLVDFEIPGTSENVLLAGTIKGLYSIDENADTKYIDEQIRLKEEPELVNYITKLQKSKSIKSVIYVGKVNAFFSIINENGRWKRNAMYNSIKDEIRSIKEDKFGNIWLATYFNGLLQIKNTDKDTIIITYDEKSGLPSKKDINISSFGDDLIFGTETGVYIYDYKLEKFKKDTRFDDNSNETYCVFRFVEKNDSVFWMSTYNSQKRWIEKGTFTIEGNIEIDRTPFKRLPSEQIDAIFHDSDNITWLGCSSGLYSYDNNFHKNYDKPFNAFIREIVTANDSVLFYGNYYKKTKSGDLIVSKIQPDELKFVLPYEFNDLTFSYAAPFFEDEKSIKFSYLLEGYKDTWSNWKKETKSVFTNLREGKYIFKVKAKNIYDVESTIASYEFTILPPWYRTIVAYVFYGILIIVIMVVVVKLYTRKLEHEKVVLEGIVQERTAEIRKQKDQITSSIVYAKRIQQAVVPSKATAEGLLPEHFLLWRPKDIVSGDFWWMSEKNGKVIIAAADSTGHGVPGAFMSMLGISFLNKIVNQLETVEAHTILNHLRANVKATLKQTGKDGEAKDGMDIALIILDMDNMMLQYAGAYNPLYLYRDNELIEVKADKNPIGIYIKEKESFTKHDIEMKKGDTFYIFSDGYIDQFGGPKAMKFKSKAFKQLLLDIQEKPMAEQKDILNKTIDEWRGDIEQIDDIIILGLRIG